MPLDGAAEAPTRTSAADSGPQRSPAAESLLQFADEEAAVASAGVAVAAAEAAAAPVIASYEAALSRQKQALEASQGKPSNEVTEQQSELLALEPRVAHMREAVRTCQEELASAKRILRQKQTRSLLETACTRAVQESRDKLPAFRRVALETTRQLQHQSATLREQVLVEAAARREERIRCDRARATRAAELRIGACGFLYGRTILCGPWTCQPILPAAPYANQHLPGDVPASSRPPELAMHTPVRSHLSLYLEQIAAAASTHGLGRQSGWASSATFSSAPPSPAMSAWGCRPRVQRHDGQAPPPVRVARGGSALPARGSHVAPITGDSGLQIASRSAVDGCVLDGERVSTRAEEDGSCGQALPREPRGLSRSWSAAARVQSGGFGSVDTHRPMSAMQSRIRLGSSASTESIVLIQSDAGLNHAVTSPPFLHAKRLRAKRVAAARLGVSQSGCRPHWNPYAQGNL